MKLHGNQKIWVSLELVHRKCSSRKWSLVLNEPHVLTFWSVLGAATVSSLLCPWWQGGGGRVCPFSFVSLPHAWTPFLHSLHMSFTIFKIQLTAIMSAVQWKFSDSLGYLYMNHYASHRTKHILFYCYRLITPDN